MKWNPSRILIIIIKDIFNIINKNNIFCIFCFSGCLPLFYYSVFQTYEVCQNGDKMSMINIISKNLALFSNEKEKSSTTFTTTAFESIILDKKKTIAIESLRLMFVRSHILMACLLCLAILSQMYILFIINTINRNYIKSKSNPRTPKGWVKAE